MNEESFFPKVGSKYLIDEDVLVQAFAVEGQLETRVHRGKKLRSKKLTILFDESVAMNHANYRYASGKEIAFWAEIGEEIIRGRVVICRDGLYLWLETFMYDDNNGIYCFSAKYIKID